MGAAVTKLEVVQHRVVVFGETLVCVLDGGHIGAHLVGVVRHLDNSLVGVLGRRGGISAQALQQGSRKARHLFHIVVGADTGCFIGDGCVLLDGIRTVLKQRFNAADALLKRSALGDGLGNGSPDTGRSDYFFERTDKTAA